MKGAIILILSIVFAAVLLVLVTGLVITPENAYTPTLVNRFVTGKKMIIDSIAFDFPSGFAVASRSNQLPVSKNIPICDLGFDYCFYDMGNDISTTTNEKIGLRINTKPAEDEYSCVNIIPLKNEDLKPEVIRRAGHSASFLGPVEFSALGDRSYGYIYRIYEEGKCYEIETRLVLAVGDEMDKSGLSKLNLVIDSISLLSTGERVFSPH